MNIRPEIVLVHGAFVDSSMWTSVIATLDGWGYRSVAVNNPLRSVAHDAAHVADVVSGIDGPVVLVGHSYGGFVISNAALNAANAVGLVYVAAFAPEAGETANDIVTRYPETSIGQALRMREVIAADGTSGVELYLDFNRYRAVAAHDVPAEQAKRMAAAQRPVAAGAFDTPSGVPAWRHLPSWYQVSRDDAALHPLAQQAMAERSGSFVIDLDASHSSPVSHPAAIAELIRVAAEYTAH
ncbi:alpha/beta hydrolase [Nocardia altamirensis]|uniref:alpha/beta hydrolase n=1 Tax=Nocardia altamirensis TaxID=472158 RepID=UPI000A038764|nr:alpha/beta hydrolase [Nocardia altamirensis]